MTGLKRACHTDQAMWRVFPALPEPVDGEQGLASARKSFQLTSSPQKPEKSAWPEAEARQEEVSDGRGPAEQSPVGRGRDKSAECSGSLVHGVHVLGPLGMPGTTDSASPTVLFLPHGLAFPLRTHFPAAHWHIRMPASLLLSGVSGSRSGSPGHKRCDTRTVGLIL